MSGHMTPEQVRQDHLAKMGDPLGGVYHELQNELTWLYLKWGEYVELFGTSPERIDLLNKSSPSFFRIVQDSLWENILLHIACLTDPPRSAGKDNLSVQRLPPLVDAKTAETLASQIAIAKGKTEFCRDWRNRRIAHRDLNLALGEKAEPLKPASRESVRGALDSLADVLNSVSVRYLNATTMFHLADDPMGAKVLLHVLDDGVKARIRRQARMETGKCLPEDFADRNL